MDSEKKKENCKREGGKLEMEGGKLQKWGEDLSKPLKFVLGLQKWEFGTNGKSISCQEKIWKNDLAPTEKYSSYASDCLCL